MHVDTEKSLGSHDKKFGRPIAGQQEVGLAYHPSPISFSPQTREFFTPAMTVSDLRRKSFTPPA